MLIDQILKSKLGETFLHVEQPDAILREMVKFMNKWVHGAIEIWIDYVEKIIHLYWYVR